MDALVLGRLGGGKMSLLDRLKELHRGSVAAVKRVLLPVCPFTPPTFSAWGRPGWWCAFFKPDLLRSAPPEAPSFWRAAEGYDPVRGGLPGAVLNKTMKKLKMFVKEAYNLVRRHKLYFLLPSLILLAFLTILVVNGALP